MISLTPDRHHLCILTLRDRLFLAPVEEPRHILDLGTGTGTWAIDVADKFEDADVLGIDLTPVSTTEEVKHIGKVAIAL